MYFTQRIFAAIGVHSIFIDASHHKNLGFLCGTIRVCVEELEITRLHLESGFLIQYAHGGPHCDLPWIRRALERRNHAVPSPLHKQLAFDENYEDGDGLVHEGSIAKEKPFKQMSLKGGTFWACQGFVFSMHPQT